MQYTKVASDAFTKLQLNAGIMVDSFDPSTGTIGNIMGATTGGFQFASNPEYIDWGEDVDNVPSNTWQLKRIKSFDPSITGTFLTVTAATVAALMGGAATNSTHIIPIHDLEESDFDDVWVIGDYSDKNTGTSAGFLAVHLKHALNTAGFQWTSAKDEKGQFAFEYHGHYDLTDVEDVPFEVYCAVGSAPSLTALTVSSSASGVTTAGDSKISVTGYTLGDNEYFVYKCAESTAPSVSYGDRLNDWTILQSPTGTIITPESTDTKITVAVVNSAFRAFGAGDATLTKKSS